MNKGKLGSHCTVDESSHWIIKRKTGKIRAMNRHFSKGDRQMAERHTDKAQHPQPRGDTTLYLLEWPLLQRKKINIDKDMEKTESLDTVQGMEINTTLKGKQ